MHRSTEAVISLVVGLCAVLTVWAVVPVFILTPMALFLGLRAVSRTSDPRNNLSGKGFAIAGICLGALAPLVLVPILIAAIFMNVAVLEPMKRVLLSGMPVAEKSEQVESALNAVAIVEACQLFAAGHHGAYPANLQELVRAGLLDSKRLQDPSRHTADSSLGTAAQALSSAAGDYVYLGDRLVVSDRLNANAANIIVVYGRVSYAGGTRIVGFANDTADPLTPGAFAEKNKVSNRIRNELGIPSTP